MRCEICQRGLAEVDVLHRVNEKGMTGRWRCEAHPPQQSECYCNSLLGHVCGYHQYIREGCAVTDAILGRTIKESEGRNG